MPLFLFSLWPHPRHAQVPRPGLEPVSPQWPEPLQWQAWSLTCWAIQELLDTSFIQGHICILVAVHACTHTHKTHTHAPNHFSCPGPSTRICYQDHCINLWTAVSLTNLALLQLLLHTAGPRIWRGHCDGMGSISGPGNSTRQIMSRLFSKLSNGQSPQHNLWRPDLFPWLHLSFHSVLILTQLMASKPLLPGSFALTIPFGIFPLGIHGMCCLTSFKSMQLSSFQKGPS